MSLARSSATVGSLTLVSRMFGFVRDMLVAYFLGASILTDAFFVAFKLPNFLRRLFAEGAFNAGFLPMFAGMVKTEGRDAAIRFASEAASFLLWVLVAVSVLGIVFMPHVMFILAPGFDAHPEKFDLAVALTRVTFPYILFISLVSLLGGVLNSVDKFAAVAAAPIWMNISMIAGLWLFRPYVENDAYAFAWGVTLAGLVQFVWLVIAAKRAGVLPRFFLLPRLTPGIRRLLALIAPAALGAGVAQVNLMVDLMLASLLPHNAVSFLYYADRLYELPLGVIGIAVSTALLPLLSRQIRAGEHDAAKANLNQAISLVMLFGLPSAGALLVIATPIIRTIFEQGHFTPEDTAAVAPALVAFAAGLPAFLLAKIFSSCFYASQDTRTPVRIAIVCVIVNFALNILLMQFLQHVGMALATTLSGWLNALLLGIGLKRRHFLKGDAALRRFLAKIIFATLLMMAALYAAGRYLDPWLSPPGLAVRIMALLLLIAIGTAAYFGTMIATKALDPRRIRLLFKPKTTTA